MATTGWEYTALPVLLFAAIAVGMGGAMILAGKVVGPRRDGSVKDMPYESGMDPIHDTRRRFDVRFHLVAIAFLVFDVELLFLYPWAVASHPAESSVPVAAAAAQMQTPAQGIDAAVASGTVESRGLVFGGAMLFLVLLTVGLVYDWRKGVFQWR
jgi:NADH-quinone oxidoreductase subunit A